MSRSKKADALSAAIGETPHPSRSKAPSQAMREFETRAENGARRASPRRRLEAGARVNAYIDPDLERKLRKVCATVPCSLGYAIEEGIKLWFESAEVKETGT